MKWSSFQKRTILRGGRGKKKRAFLYYFELLIQIEDCKYNYDEFNDDYGRSSSIDSLLVISSYANGYIDLADMLMRFVRLRGIARCYYDEYQTVTNHIITINHVKNVFRDFGEEKFIEYKMSRKFSVNNDLKIPIKIEFPVKRIIVGEEELSEEINELIIAKGWTYYNQSKYITQENGLNPLLEIIEGSKDYFEIDKELKSFIKSANLKKQKKLKITNDIKEYPYLSSNGKQFIFLVDNVENIDENIKQNYEVFLLSEYNNFELFDVLKEIVRHRCEE